MIDLTDRLELEDKQITVLDCVLDVESVLAKYAKRGWTCVHTSHVPGVTPPSLILHLQRPKRP